MKKTNQILMKITQAESFYMEKNLYIDASHQTRLELFLNQVHLLKNMNTKISR